MTWVSQKDKYKKPSLYVDLHLSRNQILQVSFKVEYELDKAMLCVQSDNFHVFESFQTFKFKKKAFC